MLDIKLIREDPQKIESALRARGVDLSLKELLTLDAERRNLLRDAEALKAQRNKASEAIGQAKRQGKDAAHEQARMREVGERIKALDAEIRDSEMKIEQWLLQLPNLSHESVPVAATTEGNVEEIGR